MRLSEEAARRLSAGARVGRLATIDPDGRPNVVPFCFALSGAVLYTAVDDKPKSGTRLRRTTNLLRDPRATVLVDHYEEDWTRTWWVRLRGSGRVVDDPAERERAVAALRDKYPQYRDQPLEDAVVAVDVEDWRGWSFSPVE